MQKKPTINASSESRLEPSELRFKPIQTHQIPHTDPTQPTNPPSSKPTISTVVKTHTSKETHHWCLVGIIIGAIGALIQTHRSHQSPHVDPSDSTLRKPRGLRSEESREQMRKREKRREIMREKREIPKLKRRERVLKNYFFIQFSYSTILHLRWSYSTISKKFNLYQV